MTRNIFSGSSLSLAQHDYDSLFICQFIHQIVFENMLSAGPLETRMVKTRLKVLKRQKDHVRITG